MFNNLFLANPSASSGTYWISSLSTSLISPGVPTDIAVDSSLNTYTVTGLLSANGTGSIAKLTSSGTLAWQRDFSASTGAYFYSTALDSSGIYAAGSLWQQFSPGLVLVKYSDTGSILWQRTLGSASEAPYPKSTAVDSSGNIYCVGNLDSASGSSLFIVKYNSSGTLQWQRRTSGTSDTLTSVAVDSSGNVYAVGYQVSGDSFTAIVIKYNTSGTLQWQRRIANTYDCMGTGIAVDSSANVYVTGIFRDSVGAASSFLIKYNTSGTMQWMRSSSDFTDSTYSSAPKIKLDTNANSYIIATAKDDALGSSYDFLITKYNTSGTLQWQRRLYAGAMNVGYNLALSSDGSTMFLNGYSSYTFGPTQGNAIFTLKLPTDGSNTGQYGPPSSPINYQPITYSSTTPGLTLSTSTITFSTASLTAATSTATDAAGTLTSQVTYI